MPRGACSKPRGTEFPGSWLYSQVIGDDARSDSPTRCKCNSLAATFAPHESGAKVAASGLGRGLRNATAYPVGAPRSRNGSSSRAGRNTASPRQPRRVAPGTRSLCRSESGRSDRRYRQPPGTPRARRRDAESPRGHWADRRPRFRRQKPRFWVGGLASYRLAYSSKLRSIQAFFSCTCMRWVRRSSVGSS